MIYNQTGANQEARPRHPLADIGGEQAFSQRPNATPWQAVYACQFGYKLLIGSISDARKTTALKFRIRSHTYRSDTTNTLPVYRSTMGGMLARVTLGCYCNQCS